MNKETVDELKKAAEMLLHVAEKLSDDLVEENKPCVMSDIDDEPAPLHLHKNAAGVYVPEDIINPQPKLSPKSTKAEILSYANNIQKEADCLKAQLKLKDAQLRSAVTELHTMENALRAMKRELRSKSVVATISKEEKAFLDKVSFQLVQALNYPYKTMRKKIYDVIAFINDHIEDVTNN